MLEDEHACAYENRVPATAGVRDGERSRGRADRRDATDPFRRQAKKPSEEREWDGDRDPNENAAPNAASTDQRSGARATRDIGIRSASANACGN